MKPIVRVGRYFGREKFMIPLYGGLHPGTVANFGI